MAVVFSPIDQSELGGPFKPRPRTAFVMRQLSGAISDNDQELVKETNAALSRAKFKPMTAADVRGTGDFLQKIVDLIRGCGFGVAVFSDQTPAKALANIFFEVGIASILGKPVQLVMTGANPVPSDFVRTEWISYKLNNKTNLKKDLKKSLERMEELGPYFRNIGEVALEGSDADLELAFERFRQAILISDDKIARERMTELKDRLDSSVRRFGDLTSHHRKLKEAVSHFLKLLPSGA